MVDSPRHRLKPQPGELPGELKVCVNNVFTLRWPRNNKEVRVYDTDLLSWFSTMRVTEHYGIDYHHGNSSTSLMTFDLDNIA